MPELRVILLIVGVLFVAAIAGFEWWRARRDRPAGDVPREEALARRARAARRRPLPEISVAREPRSTVRDTLPVIELGKPSRGPARVIRAASPFRRTSRSTNRSRTPRRRRSSARTTSRTSARTTRFPRCASYEYENPAADGPKLVLAWPGESERRIVTLRVVPNSEPRFAGRSLRQAFGSAGFWHGPLDIYHLPDAEGRVIVSAAALAQPGTFDPSIMDSQRFSGLNLFAVLPGPLPEREAFDELVHAARALAERLDARSPISTAKS